MTRCPFCKRPTPNTKLACSSCGRLASDHPSVQQKAAGDMGDAWNDDVPGDPLELQGAGAAFEPAPFAGPAPGASFGMGEEDPFSDELPAGALELDMLLPEEHDLGAKDLAPADPAPEPQDASPASPPPDEPPPPPTPIAAVASSVRGGAAQPAYGKVAAAQEKPADPAAIIARLPAPPRKLWGAAPYFVRVLWRQLELRQDLESLRRRRSPDVPLYERALKAHDARSYAVGMAITCAAIAIATFVFFLPVILRFVRDPN